MGTFSGTDTTAFPESRDSGYGIADVTETVTPGVLQLYYHKGWFVVPILASPAMLGASITTAILGLLCTRPDILDRVSMLVKDSPYIVATCAGSVQNHLGSIRLKDVQLSLEDINHKANRYSVVRTVDEDAFDI
jgi:hypothetical protein